MLNDNGEALKSDEAALKGDKEAVKGDEEASRGQRKVLNGNGETMEKRLGAIWGCVKRRRGSVNGD